MSVTFSVFFRATKAFQEVLYREPGFSKANEVHIRLGLMCKASHNYEASLKVSISLYISI